MWFKQYWEYIDELNKMEEEYLWDIIKTIIIETGRFNANDWILEKSLYTFNASENEIKTNQKIRLVPNFGV